MGFLGSARMNITVSLPKKFVDDFDIKKQQLKVVCTSFGEIILRRQ